MKAAKPIGLFALGTLIALAVFWSRGIHHQTSGPLIAPPQAATNPQLEAGRIRPVDPQDSFVPGKIGTFAKLAGQFTEGERVFLTNAFDRRFKPAVENWCKAYEGRVPFKAEDFKLEQFHSWLASSYTFMVNNDTTLTIGDNTNGSWVCYMAVGPALGALNSMPAPGTIPITAVPITKDAILQMVKADTGNVFERSDITIQPTGISGAMNGGAFVDVGGLKADGLVHITGSNMHLVFDANGMLVSYGGTVATPPLAQQSN
jgi:hypothetical protein